MRRMLTFVLRVKTSEEKKKSFRNICTHHLSLSVSPSTQPGSGFGLEPQLHSARVRVRVRTAAPLSPGPNCSGGRSGAAVFVPTLSLASLQRSNPALGVSGAAVFIPTLRLASLEQTLSLDTDCVVAANVIIPTNGSHPSP